MSRRERKTKCLLNYLTCLAPRKQLCTRSCSNEHTQIAAQRKVNSRMHAEFLRRLFLQAHRETTAPAFYMRCRGYRIKYQ